MDSAWGLALLPRIPNVASRAEQNFTTIVSLYERHLGVIHLRRMENAKTSEIHVAQALMAEVLPWLTDKSCLQMAKGLAMLGFQGFER
jgi:hypothetical protein